MSLKLRLVSIALVLPMLLMVALVLIALPLHRDTHEARLEAELTRAATLIEPMLLSALRANDAPALAAHARRLLDLPEIKAAAILDADDALRAEAGRLVEDASLEPRPGRVRQKDGQWRMTYPLARAGGGRLVMDVDASGILLQHYRQLAGAGLLLALVAGILGLATMTTYRRLKRPLEEVDATLARLARGEPVSSLPPSPPELPPLASHANALALQLQQTRDEMQHQVAQATAELEESMETVEIQNMQLDLAHRHAVKANRAKSEFLASMSHEIRTPLNGIVGFCRLLGRSSLNARQQEWLTHVDRACDNLLLLVNDVLDYSRLETGRLELERMPVQMVELVDEVLALQAPMAQQKALELVGMVYDDVPPVLHGDPMRIRQLLTNLVDNAVKFTERGEVLVRVTVEESEPTHVTLGVSVSDTGIGLSNEHKQHLFDAFHQAAPSHSREFGGSGLGLSICRQLVEQMGGEIGVESEPNRGSTFAFTLPLAGDIESERPPELRLAGETILLEEPHPGTRRALRHLLRRWGARPLPADTPAAPTPSLVMISLGAPPYSPERLRHWEQRLAELPCPALLLCTASPLDFPDLALPRGGEMLAKPLARGTLAEAVERLLETGGNDALASPAEGPTSALDAGLRLLAVDDNATNRRLMGELLTGPGMDITLVSSGEEALTVGRRRHFDLVLMDIRMPDMDGIEATRELRHLSDAWRRTPIIAVTAHALEGERRRLMASGLDDVLTKPLDIDHLSKLLTHHLGDAPAHLSSTPPAPAPGEPSRLPVVDLALGTRLAGGREPLAQRLLEQLVDSLDEMEDTICRARADEDDEALLDAIHGLNGACRYCGAPRLGLTAETLETHLRTRGREAMAPLLEELLHAMAELRQWREASASDPYPSSTTKATANSFSSDNDR
ncbi:ATP-binding protein [Halomonas halodenitrificans]|uniref:ATP-binding protein n=1 Tax=Halomonas halodenitrificans TaxID=28252 RepID=UPI000489C3D8|nr:ATP-binding protein [Halomonas halodenitrificans]